MKSRTIRGILLKLEGQKICAEVCMNCINIEKPRGNLYSVITTVGDDVFELESFENDKSKGKSYHAINAITNIWFEIENV